MMNIPCSNDITALEEEKITLLHAVSPPMFVIVTIHCYRD